MQRSARGENDTRCFQVEQRACFAILQFSEPRARYLLSSEFVDFLNTSLNLTKMLTFSTSLLPAFSHSVSSPSLSNQQTVSSSLPSTNASI